jgi:hypothetical protein
MKLADCWSLLGSADGPPSATFSAGYLVGSGGVVPEPSTAMLLLSGLASALLLVRIRARG